MADGRHERSAPVSSRVPPHNIDAEASVLGAMLLSRDAIADAIEVVAAEHFYKPAHVHIFEAITSLYSAGEPADPVTVAEELTRAGVLERIGGPAALVTLQANTPATSSASTYARIVLETAMLRRMIGVANDIAEIGYSRPDDVEKAIDHAESLMYQVAEGRAVDTLSPISDLLDQNLDRLEQLYERGESLTGTPSGYADLDDLLSGLQPNALIVVGARPAMGKTAFALGMAAHAAVEHQRPVLLFSLEMSQLEISQRILCSEARVDSKHVRDGKLTESDWAKISNGVGRLAEAPLWIDDNPNLTLMEIRAKARRLKSRTGDLGMVIVDYLQLMTGRAGAESRQVEVAELSRGLKILARELQVPVVALSQLSRTLESRQDKRPMLADLRESGCLTADTRLLRADTGAEVTLGELVSTGERNVPVWALDDNWRLVPSTLTHAFPSGTKPVYRMTLRSGRHITATANHRFRTHDGWRHLDELQPGDVLAAAQQRFLVDIGQHGTWSEPRARGATAVAETSTSALATLSTTAEPAALETPDVWWDEIMEIVPAGVESVYDATVLEHHNFVANGIVAHNSIEQDADVVMFIYRDEVYNPETADVGTAEIVVAKHRNGPTGVIRLAFLPHYTRFANMARVT